LEALREYLGNVLVETGKKRGNRENIGIDGIIFVKMDLTEVE